MLLAAVVGLFQAPALAQQPASLPTQDITVRIERSAETTRDLLRSILRTYPDAVGEVLRRDPSLMSRADYMAAYPELTQFLTSHPEVQRNVEYYFDSYAGWQSRHQLDPEFEALGVLLGGMAGLFVVTGLMSVFAWLVRAVIQHRRWLKASQVQADVHTKLMERMTTNEELLAYIQSPAGRRFLEAAPVRPEADSAPTNAPIGPIIWSMMAGIVLSTVGAGFRYSASFIADEAHQAFIVVGVIILALGIGFMIASLMAFVVSSRLGLFPPRRPVESTSTNA